MCLTTIPIYTHLEFTEMISNELTSINSQEEDSNKVPVKFETSEICVPPQHSSLLSFK